MSIRNQSILVIDDDARLLRALHKVLSAAGARVTSAEWAGDALELLAQRQTRIDLVITDLRMPHMTGLTVVYAIHQIFPAVPVVVLTAFGNSELRAACLREGAAAFLEKPLDTPQLLAALESVLGTPSATESPPEPNAQPSGEGNDGTRPCCVRAPTTG